MSSPFDDDDEIPPGTPVRQILLTDLAVDPAVQSRANIHQPTVEEYTGVLRGSEGVPAAELRPVVAYDDGVHKWLSSGFHRYAAYQRAGRLYIPCVVRSGTRRDAIWFSVGRNAKHGLRRTQADKRHAIMAMLSDPEWEKLLDTQIANQCAVDYHTVQACRKIKAHEEADNLRQAAALEAQAEETHKAEEALGPAAIRFGEEEEEEDESPRERRATDQVVETRTPEEEREWEEGWNRAMRKAALKSSQGGMTLEEAVPRWREEQRRKHPGKEES